MGGSDYLKHQVKEMLRGFEKGEGRWASYKDNEALGTPLMN